MRGLAVFALRVYKRAVSPFLPPACRFYPSCSEYAALAIEKHGVLRGGILAAQRLARCHPWHPGGFDAVPER
jgi:putative membrane protein insertion efficiency factor